MGTYTQRTGGIVMKFLVTGLESSSTKIVSRMVAQNLNLIDHVDNWDGHDFVFDDNNLVVHRSIPHGLEDYFIDENFLEEFDIVILSTRDWNCSLLSKIEHHEHNVIEANQQHLQGIKVIKNILNKKEVFIFSSETAFLLQEAYTTLFLRSIGIGNPIHTNFENPNRKYLKEIGL
jgi:hypothetical protein